jgi:hypothetical protein
MFKKNSWIVALILALAVTALFTGCIEALEPEPEVTYTEVNLGDFNAWGGQAYQKGWAVAGIVFDGLGNAQEKAADLGYKNEDFAAATRLVIEMPDDSYPKGNIDLIWGAEKANGVEVTRWNQTGNITRSKEGNILTIDLTKMNGYSAYKDPSITKRKLVIQAGGDDMKKLVKSAKLLIPDVGFIAVSDISLSAVGVPNFEFTLNGVVAPIDATNQVIHWSIVSFKPVTGPTLDLPYNSDGTPNTTGGAYATALAALKAKVNFVQESITLRPDQPEVLQPDYEYWDWSVLPPVKVTVAGDGETLIPALPGQTENVTSTKTLVATEAGTVTFRATVENGKTETGTTAAAHYTKDFTVKIVNTYDPAIAIAQKSQAANSSTLIGTALNVKHDFGRYGLDINNLVKYTADANGIVKNDAASGTGSYDGGTWFYGASGSEKKATDDSNYNPTNAGVTVGNTGGWPGGVSGGNVWVALELTLESGKGLSDYSTLIFTFQGIDGDKDYKEPIKVRAFAAAPDASYFFPNDTTSPGFVAVTPEGTTSTSSAKTYLLDLNSTLTSAQLTNNKVYLVFYYHTGIAHNLSGYFTEYRYSNIKLIAKGQL